MQVKTITTPTGLSILVWPEDETHPIWSQDLGDDGRTALSGLYSDGEAKSETPFYIRLLRRLFGDGQIVKCSRGSVLCCGNELAHERLCIRNYFLRASHCPTCRCIYFRGIWVYDRSEMDYEDADRWMSEARPDSEPEPQYATAHFGGVGHATDYPAA